MPTEIQIDAERSRIIVEIKGISDVGEVLRAIEQASQDPDFRPGFDVLSDHSQETTPLLSLDAKDVVEHVAEQATIWGGVRWAIVSERSSPSGMLRMIATLARHVPMESEIFGTREEAMAWLDARRGRGDKSPDR